MRQNNSPWIYFLAVSLSDFHLISSLFSPWSHLWPIIPHACIQWVGHLLLTIPFSSCLLDIPLTWTHHFTQCLAKQIIPTHQGNPRTLEFSKVGEVGWRLRWLNFSHSWTTHSHDHRQCMAVVECRLCSPASGVWIPTLHSLHVLGEFFASPCVSFLIWKWG